MTTETNDNDPRVSETYQAMATETTPPELDEKILSMAADSGRPAYGLSRAWFRPMAWVATIGLSLAFVLEMSELNDVAEPAATYLDADEMLEERVVGDQAVKDTMDDSRLRQELDERSDVAVEAKASSPPAAVEVAPAEDAPSVSEDFAADNMMLLREAEEQARARAGPARAVAVNGATAALAMKKEQASLCDESARVDAASWYACVEDLREKDLGDAAGLELEALLSEFPDFQIPEESR